MNDVNDLKERYKDTHPGFNSYLECTTRALFTGLSTFTIAFSGIFLGQGFMKKHLPYTRNGRILLAAGVAVASSYHFTSTRIFACQAAWLAVEEKHTALSD